jgi:hypothetical protein
MCFEGRRLKKRDIQERNKGKVQVGIKYGFKYKPTGNKKINLEIMKELKLGKVNGS